MKQLFSHIQWASAHHIKYIPIIVLGIAISVWQYYKRNQAIKMLAHSTWSALLIGHFSQIRQLGKQLCVILGLSLLFIAFLQPQWHKKEEPVTQKGRDIFIAFDISKSMLAEDVQPNRLTLAKNKIKQLLRMLSCERIGLMLFAGVPVIQCPLTTDYDAFLMFLNQIDHNTISSGTTAIDKAIQKALELFNTNQQLSHSKVLLLFTDGEDFSSNLSAIKDEARRLGLRIITVGVGTAAGAPIPLFDERQQKKGYQLDQKGNVVISRLNEGILNSLAHNLNGLYVPVSHDTTDLKKIVSYIEHMEKENFEDKKIQTLQDQYHYFIAVAFVCFLLEWIL